VMRMMNGTTRKKNFIEGCETEIWR